MDTPRSPRRVLALDFDGVICDSIDEGLLISWYGYTGARVAAFVEPGMAGVPAEAAERFIGCRPFTRHLGHWLVPFTVDSVPASHAEFAARYEELPPETIESFLLVAGEYRTRVRSELPQRWLACHRVYGSLGDLVSGAYIVTARDVESVSQILDANAMVVERDRIYGSLVDKIGALDEIAVREAVEPGGVTLVDDSIENCIAIAEAGYGALWATWGYTCATDAELARAHGVRAITLDALRSWPRRALSQSAR